MAPTPIAVSRHVGLAIATAVTGLVLAAGVSIATLVGWLGPTRAVNEPAQASMPGQAGLEASPSSTSQFVLVPGVPNTLPTETIREHGRPQAARVGYGGERDDD
ncbi:MAG TPA: hypothetical protein VF937_03450 [Chloroflexota bacterium]